MPETLGRAGVMRTDLQLYALPLVTYTSTVQAAMKSIRFVGGIRSDSTLFQRHLVVRFEGRNLIGQAEEKAHNLQKLTGWVQESMYIVVLGLSINSVG